MLYDCQDLNIQTITIKEKPQLTYNVSEDDVKQIKLFNEMVKDRSTSLVQSIADICRIINKEEFEKDYGSNEDPVITGISLLERLSAENDRLNEIVNEMKERYLDDHDRFIKDREIFETQFPGWMAFFERLINNSMLYECFPFIDKRADRTRVYKGLCFAYGLLRLICIYIKTKSSSKEELIDAVSLLFHLIDHTSFYYNVSILADNAAVMLKI